MLRRLALALVLPCVFTLAACGGALQAPDVRDAGGAKIDNYQVVRYDMQGLRNAALSGSLDLSLERAAGDQLALSVAVEDSSYTTTVAVDVLYDAAQVHPVRVAFKGLLGDDSQVISAAFLTQTPGCAGIGQAAIGDYVPGPLNGVFAVVYFERTPFSSHTVSRAPTQAVDVTVGGLPNSEVTSDTAAKTAAVKWYAGFNKADGDQNQQVNIADITPIGQKFMKRWSGAGAVWACLPADYDGNTEVNLGDITPIGQNFQATANTFLVEAGDDTAAAPTAVTTVTWDSATPPDGTAADGVLAKVFKSWQVDFTSSSPFTYTQLKALDTNSNNLVNVYVTPQDSASPPVKGATATMTISVAPSAVTITSIDLSFAGSDTWLKSGSDYALLVTELSADSVAGNGEIFAAAPFAPEKIQLVATCESAEDPGVPFDGTGNVIFYIQSGEGLATVGNGGIAPKGELAFKDRGIVTIAAHAPGNFLIEDTITFRLFSIDSLALELAAGGSGPVNVNAGQSVPFKVTGTFDFDTTVNGNELTQDLTQFCNWGALVNPATSPITFDSGVGSLDTAGAASGAEYQVTCEFPKTDNVLIYDNLKRYSNFLVVNIN